MTDLVDAPKVGREDREEKAAQLADLGGQKRLRAIVDMVEDMREMMTRLEDAGLIRKKTNLERAIEENGKGEPEPVPLEIQSDFEAYGMDAEALFKLHTDLTSKIAGNLPVTDAERALQSRLTPHVPWMKKRAAIEVV